MEEIKAIISKYDIAAYVVLHNPGHSEYYFKSYSCASFEGDNKIRIKAKLQDDFNGDRKAWTKKVEDTSNMLTLLAVTTGKNSLALMSVSDMLDRHVDASHGDSSHTSHNEQNN